MGWQATGWAFKAPIPNPGAKFVLVALAERAGNEDDEHDWTCYPSIETIAEYTAQGYRTIQRHLDWLEEQGFISRSRRVTAKGRKGAYNFTLHRNPVARDKMAGGHDGQDDLPNGAAEVARNGQTEPVIGTDQGTVEAIASVGAADAARHAFDGYNLMASQAGLPLAQKLTDQRRRAINARLKDYDGQKGWTEALERVARSPFLTGKTDANFRATLDFILQPSSFTKLMEGRYEDRHDRGSPASTSSDRSIPRPSPRIEAMVDGARQAVAGGRRRWWIQAGVGGAPDRDQSDAEG